MTIQLVVEQHYVLLKSDQSNFSEDAAKECVAQINGITEHRPLVILDLSNVQEMAVNALRTLTRAFSASAQSEFKLALVCSKNIQKLVTEQGLDRLFACHASIDELIKPDGGSAKERALEFLNTTLEAVAYTLQVSTNTVAKPGKGFVRGRGSVMETNIAATVGVVSSPFTGALTLGFPTKTYLGVMSRLLGTEYKEMCPEIGDGVAELLNIILGQVKISLNELGFDIKQAIPTVVQGANVQILPSANRPSVIVPYETDVGNFYIELTTNADR